ncbi:hypothetical protein [Microcystis sp. M061S2]|uniref:hypothetical protein n=1 Tax=Microcystis sp. M061S2 TaxID=2771171 RepID=UPI002585697B|nr:hypothetical protein [Microcystis sp. M061S2]MCA2653186.1 hypothetical protein [Microcystis sp. M061S2]
MNDKGFNPLTASRDATSNVPRGVPSSSQDEWVALGKTLSQDFQDWLRNQSVGWLADQDLRQEIIGQISLLEAEIQPLLQINRELVELEQLLTTGFSTTNFEEGGEQSASASENQPSSGATALSSEELASHQDGINPISEPKLKKEAESSPPSFHPQPESQLQVGGLKNLAQRLEFEQQQQKSSAKTQAEIASPTQLLPEIPNSPSSQQLGETTNIALPLSREGIINEYQSTPSRELSPPIDREEENPPPRNYSPTSKVNPTYASSSILSANPTDSAKTKPLPEIPNSPTSQQLGATTNIALPLRREGIINEYQSTPSRELSPPIDREEENPPPRNYSPTSKVNPTYASSSLLLANSLPVETVSPQEKEKKSDEPINDSPTGNSINKSKSSDLSTTQEDNFSDRQGTFSNLDQENRRERKNPLTRVSQQNSRIFSLKNTAKFSHKYARSKSPSPNFDTTEQPQVLKKIEEKSQAISESIPQQSHLCEAEIDLIIEAIAQEIQQQYRQFYGS